MKKIPIKSSSGIQWIEAGHIVYFEARGNRSWIFLADDSKILSPVTLKHYSNMLHLKGFYRIHDKHLVNKEFVENYIPKTRAVILASQIRLEASFKRKTGFLNFMYEK